MLEKEVKIGGKRIVFEIDERENKVKSVKDGSRKIPYNSKCNPKKMLSAGELCEVENVEFRKNGETPSELPLQEGDILITKHNPTCVWYYSAARRWYVYCF